MSLKGVGGVRALHPETGRGLHVPALGASVQSWGSLHGGFVLHCGALECARGVHSPLWKELSVTIGTQIPAL